MRYLITGGAGFIGSHLTEALIAKGHEITVLDDLSTGSLDNLALSKVSGKLEFIQGCVTDSKLVDSLVSKSDGIFHLAAAVGVQKILEDPLGSLKTNIEGTEMVLNAAVTHQKEAILASTSEIYGKNDSGPLTEDSPRILGSPLLVRWTYSEAKAIDEAVARFLFDKKGLRVKIVRFFNTVGPRQSPAYGMVIPRFFEAALQDKPLKIYGDGNQQRVFCHISDAISGLLSLWDSEVGFGEAFNLGGIEEISIKQLSSKIIEITNSKSSIEFVPYEELIKKGFEDMLRRLPVTQKLQDATGWKAKRGIDFIIADTYNYFQKTGPIL